MGGGGGLGDLGGVVNAVVNPTGYGIEQLTGNKQLAFLSNPTAGLTIKGTDKLLGGGGSKSVGGGMVYAQPFGAGEGYDEYGRPVLKEFDSRLGGSGLLGQQYQLQDTLDRRGLEGVRAEALRDPAQMSRWGQVALGQARNQAALQSAGQQQQAQNQLAMQGGLRTGARERLAASGVQNQLRSGQAALANIQSQDEQSRQKWLGMLPQQELATAQYQNTLQDKNIGRSLEELQQQREYDKFRYGQGMAGWAAQQTGDSMARSAAEGRATSGLFGGGGFLGLGI